ncbi:RDD family protein [Bacillus coreaensis]
MFCTNCGSKVINESKFCPYCGQKILLKSSERNKSVQQIRIEKIYPHAGFWLRFWAYVFDCILIGVPSILLVLNNQSFGIFTFLGGLLYYVGLESSPLQGTLGKKMCGIIVTDDQGNRITAGKAFGRFFARYISSITIIGFPMAGWTENKQGLHDKMTKCFVIKRNEEVKIIKHVIHSKDHNEKITNIGGLSRRVKKEVSSLPIITAVGDAILGASGLDTLQEQMKDNPYNPINYIFYYEAFITYKKVKSGVNVARLVFNPVGFAISQGVSAGLNSVDDEFQKFDPQKCLDTALALAMKNIKEETHSSIDLVVIGKSQFYRGINEIDQNQSRIYLEKSVHYLSLACELESDHVKVAEYLFYLAQAYQQLGKEDLQFRSLNVSRKLGFGPSLELIKQLLQERRMKDLNIDNIVCTNYTFQFTYDSGDKLEKALTFTIKEQGQKFSNTTKRVKEFLNT